MDSFIEKLTAISGKIANNWVIHVIMNGFTMLMPVTMLGAFIALFNGLGFEAYQAFITSTGIKATLTTAYQWTTGLFGLYIAFLVALAFAREKKCAKSDIAVALTSLVCFLIVTPYVTPEEPFAPTMLPTTWLGSSGMFTAIVIAFVVGFIYLFCQDHNVEIKLPEQVPPFISAQFSSLIPGAFCLILFSVISHVLAGTSFETLHQVIYSFVAVPLQAASANVFGHWILLVALYCLWFFGIHGGMTVGPIISMLFMQLQMENLTAFQAGQPLPHMVIGDALSYGSGSLPMLVAALLFMRSEQGKAVSRMAILPAFFNVDEPAYFGMPMILNPIFFIPWVIGGPTISVLGSYVLKVIGLLPYCNNTGSAAYNLPFFVGNTMNYGTAGLIWGLIFFAIITLTFVPFVRAYDKQLLEAESAQQ